MDRKPSRVALRRAIEQPFLYRGVSSLEVKTVDVIEGTNSAEVAFYATTIHRNDDRLTGTPWPVVCAEQTMADTARVLRALWTGAPNLEGATLKVLRRGAIDSAADETILHLRATGEAIKRVMRRTGRDASAHLLRCCEMRYAFDPQYGLRALTEKTAVGCADEGRGSRAAQP